MPIGAVWGASSPPPTVCSMEYYFLQNLHTHSGHVGQSRCWRLRAGFEAWGVTQVDPWCHPRHPSGEVGCWMAVWHPSVPRGGVWHPDGMRDTEQQRAKENDHQTAMKLREILRTISRWLFGTGEGQRLANSVSMYNYVHRQTHTNAHVYTCPATLECVGGGVWWRGRRGSGRRGCGARRG